MLPRTNAFTAHPVEGKRQGPSNSMTPSTLSMLPEPDNLPDQVMRLVGTALENATDAVSILDLAGNYVYFNPAHRRMFRNHALALKERSDLIIHPDDRVQALAGYQEVVQSGSARRLNYRILHMNGDIAYLESQVSTITGPRGEVTHLLSVTRDITDLSSTIQSLQRRETQLNELHAIFKLGSWDWDIRSGSITWSPEMYQIFGVGADFKPDPESVRARITPMDTALRERIDAVGGMTGSVHRALYQVHQPGGRTRLVEISGTASHDESGQMLRMIGVMQDVTERKRVEEQIRISKEHLRAMVEHAREYAIYLLDQEGHVTSWNPGAERIKGYTAEEISGQHFSRFFTVEDIKRGQPARQLRLALRHGRHQSEGWRLRKNGSRFWAHVTITPIFNETGELQGFSKITHDITERRRAKENLRDYAERLRATSRRLVEIQETERRQLAIELHDRVGQNLTALGINLSLISRQLDAEQHPSLQPRVKESSRLLRQTIESMRNVMAELRPQALDDYGLFSALRLAMADFCRQTGIKASVTGRDVSASIPKTVSLAMFRIFQEALHNVAKHAHAATLEIRLDELDGHVRLEIIDDGSGFDVAHIEAQRPAQRWGLQIMRERAEAVGALLMVESGQDRGTRVIVTFRL